MAHFKPSNFASSVVSISPLQKNCILVQLTAYIMQWW